MSRVLSIAEASPISAYGSKMNPGRERALQTLWAEGRLSARPIPSDIGPLQVVFPGWANHDSGPDFRGAIIALEDGRLLKGDVEVHVTAPEWAAHGHHLDPAYDAVVLQVVWQRDPTIETLTSAGTTVPTAWLEEALDLPLEVLLLAGRENNRDPRPCVRNEHTPEEVARLLDEQGDARFLARSAALAGDAAALGDEQALYLGLMDALGYSKNRAPFREMAGRLPIQALTSMAAGKTEAEGLSFLEATVLAEADRLTSPWTTFRVRPENSPKVRLRQAAGLVQRFAREGLIEGLLAAVTRVTAAKTIPDALSLVGPGRALEMAVNVVLPFFHGWALERGEAALADHCLEQYRAWKKLPANHTAADMEGMLFAPGQARKVITGARRQQGLLQLYKQRCSTLLCQGCLLARAGE